MGRISIGGISAEPGTVKKGFLKVAARADGTTLGIPVIIANGSKEGPVLVVDGSCHGDEPEGGIAIIEVMQSLDPLKMRGTLIGTPVLNMGAFEYRARGSPFDQYYPDMNRVWPGKADGSISERVAYIYFNEVVKKAQYVWTMHGGGNILYMTQRTNVDPGSEGAMRIAKGLGTEWDICAVRLEKLPSSLTGACDQLGIPCVTTELGGAGDRIPERLQYNVQSYKKALENLLKHLGMVEGRAEYPSNWKCIEYSIPKFKNGGLAVPQPKCKLRENVRKGEPLVKVIDFFGDVVETIEAPHDGMIIGVPICPNAYPGNMVVVVGYVTKTITR